MTFAASSFAVKSSKSAGVKASGAMKRWPYVRSPEVRSPTETGTTSFSFASWIRTAMIDWRGRTQRRSPVPQRMERGQGKLRMACSITSDRTSEAGWPFFSITANQTWPFLSSRASSWSFVRPVERRKPSRAFSGASVRGPLRSSRVSGVTSGRPVRDKTRRRGVAKAAAAE